MASYNIHRCLGKDGRLAPERISGVIEELGSDIVGLQEVDARASDGGFSLQMELLAGATGYQAVPGPTIRSQNRFYGNVLLTTHPIKRVRRYDLSVSRREPRGALDVDLEVHGRPVRVIVTHFGLRGAERREQARRLLGHLGADHGGMCVLLGDTNDWSARGQAVRLLNAAFGAPPLKRTFPSRFPIFPLDRIWVKPPDRLERLTVHRSPLARLASDHLPVKARIVCSKEVA